MKRVVVIVFLFLASAIFWAGFEQHGSSFNLFADRYTQREFPALGDREIPAGWFQSVNPVFILTLSPIFAALWVALARRRREPSTPAKFAFGLGFLGLGFLVMAGAALGISSGGKVLPTWLVATYLLHTIGELCLSPVGLSSVTKLAPRRFAGQMMGVWFLATALGNLLAGELPHAVHHRRRLRSAAPRSRPADQVLDGRQPVTPIPGQPLERGIPAGLSKGEPLDPFELRPVHAAQLPVLLEVDPEAGALSECSSQFCRHGGGNAALSSTDLVDLRTVLLQIFARRLRRAKMCERTRSRW
jgi:hypothetical protein